MEGEVQYFLHVSWRFAIQNVVSQNSDRANNTQIKESSNNWSLWMASANLPNLPITFHIAKLGIMFWGGCETVGFNAALLLFAVDLSYQPNFDELTPQASRRRASGSP